MTHPVFDLLVRLGFTVVPPIKELQGYTHHYLGTGTDAEGTDVFCVVAVLHTGGWGVFYPAYLEPNGEYRTAVGCVENVTGDDLSEELLMEMGRGTPLETALRRYKLTLLASTL